MYDVSVLCAAEQSVYHSLSNDVWTKTRDVRRFAGDRPVVCHPPCRYWGRLRNMPNVVPDENEKNLARICVDHCRNLSGVLEHPAGSALWSDMNLPLPKQGPDAYGGYTFAVWQSEFGHPSRKRTWIYAVRCFPPILVNYSIPDSFKPVQDLTRYDRMATPLPFAHFLCLTATNSM